MKSLAKKLLAAFACAVLLTVPVAASETTEGSALTVESITGHQPADMITENLTLPTGYTWTASPEGIVNTETGEITRNILQDKAVTLTATKDGVETSFALVVKSLKTKVLLKDNFAYSYDSETDPMSQSGFVFKSNANTTAHRIAHEQDGNSYLTLDYTKTSEADKAAKQTPLRDISEIQAEAQKNTDIYFTFKYKYVEPDSSAQNGAYLVFNNNKSDGTKANMIAIGGKAGGQNTFGLRTLDFWGNGFAYSGYNTNGTEAWKTAIVKYNFTSSDNSVYLSDGSNFVASKNAITINGENLSEIAFVPAALGSNCGKLLIDDFVVYTETSPLTLESITGHQPANMITQNLTLDDTYEWTANPVGIVNTATGAVTRDKLEDKAVTLTAVKGTETKTFNLVVKSLRTNIIMSDNFAYDYADTVDPLAQSAFPFKHYNNTSDSSHQHKLLVETDGNQYLQLDMTYVGNEATNKQAKIAVLKCLTDQQIDSNDLYVAFKYKYILSNHSDTVGAYFKTTVGSNTANLAGIGYGNSTSPFGLWAGELYDGCGYSQSSYQANGSDAWLWGVVKWNAADRKSAVSSDGETFRAAKASISGTLTGFDIYPSGLGSDCGKLLIDDFVVYTEAEYPAEITLNESTVSVTGATEGGMLVVAQYSDNGSKLVSANVITEGFTSVQIGSVATGNTVKCFFWDKNTLQPLALSKSLS